MTIISAPRVALWALPLEALHLLITSRSALEESFGLAPSRGPLLADASFLEAFKEAIQDYTIPAVARHGSHYDLYTHWAIVEPTSRSIVGGIGGTGEPDEQGEIMIGYFVHLGWEGKGVATEATTCFCKWLMEHTTCTAIIADTPKEHLASQKVLLKSGFVWDGEVEEGYRWKLRR